MVFNPTAFSSTPAGDLGNAGQNFMMGPPFRYLDFSALPDTAVFEPVKPISPAAMRQAQSALKVIFEFESLRSS